MQKIKIKREPDLTIKHIAFDYQREAVDLIRDLPYAAVFHEQGLGKTKIAIDILLYWLKHKVVDSVIVVTKKGLVNNWKREFRSHTNIRPKILSQDRGNNTSAFSSPARVYLTHYEAIKLEADRLEAFSRVRTLAIVLDEAQKIKNPESQMTGSFFRLSPYFERKLILTGSPIANRPYDIWSQIFFLDQGESLGIDFKKFKAQLDLPDSNNQKQTEKFERRLVEIFPSIKNFAVRETKNGGRIELPDKEFENIACDWEKNQRRLYEGVRDDLRITILKDGVLTEDVSEDILKRLLRLVQIASNPGILDKSYESIPGKYNALLSIIEQVVANNEKAIIWSSFTANVDWLTRKLSKYNPVSYHGKMDDIQRNRSIDSFLERANNRLLVATPASAKEGFTLTVANHVIFYDRSFSLDDYIQAQDRIHRISQEKTCYVYNLIMKDSIDEWIDDLLETKWVAAKLGQGDLTLEEFRQTINYDLKDVLKEILNIRS